MNILIDDERTTHVLKSTVNVDMGADYEKIVCPYRLKNNEKYTECCPDNIFHKNEYCDNCPDFWKNYHIVLNSTIHSAESNPNSNIHLIRKDIERDGGKYVQIYNNQAVLLLAATTTIEDYYWLYMDSDRKLHLGSCVGAYEVIPDAEVPVEMNVLEYLRKNDRDSLLKDINTYLSNQKYDKLITKICI